MRSLGLGDLKEDVKRTVYEVVLKEMEMCVQNMYDGRTISPSAFERIMNAFDMAKDSLAADHKEREEEEEEKEAAASSSSSSHHWTRLRKEVQATSQKPSPFQVAWNELEKSTDGDLDWAVAKARCGTMAALVEIVMPVEEERLKTSVQALMGFVS